MRVAMTGHMDISPDSTHLIYDAISSALDELRLQESFWTGVVEGMWTGVSCIARGADSIFAEVILDKGFQLEVVLPSRDYRARKVKAEDSGRFDKFISAAAFVHTMPFDAAGREAYEAANKALLQSADVLLAVWDGNVSKRGGTGTVVEEAKASGTPVVVIWPEGARRESS